MRVVYDTNVLLTLTRREELAAFRAVIASKQLTLITSGYVLDELERVLHQKFKLTPQKARITTRVFARLSVVVAPHTIERICRDPNDDYIIAAALAGHTDYIVTADQDLFVVGEYRGIRIITRAELGNLLQDPASHR